MLNRPNYNQAQAGARTILIEQLSHIFGSGTSVWIWEFRATREVMYRSAKNSGKQTTLINVGFQLGLVCKRRLYKSDIDVLCTLLAQQGNFQRVIV